MILKDFEKGGFPIGRLAPVMVITDTGLNLAYDNYGLKSLMSAGTVKSLYGIWPGKHKTCLFTLDLAYYGKLAPCEADRHIDNATEITVHYGPEKDFKQIVYLPYSPDGKSAAMASENKETLEYLTKIGRKHAVVRP